MPLTRTLPGAGNMQVSGQGRGEKLSPVRRKVRDVNEKPRPFLRPAVEAMQSGASRDEAIQPYVDAVLDVVRRHCDETGLPLSIFDPKRAAIDDTLAGIEAVS